MTNALSNEREDVTYIKIVADTGKFHMEVPVDQEGQDGVVVREGSVDGNEYRKVERTFDTLKGMIKGVDIKDTDYGTNLNVKIEDVVISLNVDSSFAQDLMKKIPSIDISQPVILKPYSFKNDKSKDVRGVSITQNEEKVKNFFVDAEAKTELHGYPAFPADYESWPEAEAKDNWKVYRIGVTKFLKKYILENHKLVDEATKAEEAVSNDTEGTASEDVTADDIPGWGDEKKEEEAPKVADTPAVEAAPEVATDTKA